MLKMNEEHISVNGFSQTHFDTQVGERKLYAVCDAVLFIATQAEVKQRDRGVGIADFALSGCKGD